MKFYKPNQESSNQETLRFFRTCQNDYVCSTIDTIGRNLILINLTIPFLFFYKFDSRFNECLKNLIQNLKKKIKQKRLEKKDKTFNLTKFIRM